ncbi:MAG: response regulator [Oscillibacter sp.]|nr:response regulator [Oscillibacter sp.]
MNTLTLDDNPMILKAMAKLLSRVDPDGLHLTADTAAAAMESIRQTPPDVAFLDIELPGGSGLDVAHYLRASRPETNVIFITGHSEYAMQAFELYASGYLLKPIAEEQLRTALDNLRHPIRAREKPRLKVRCFGDFEVWCGGAPVQFLRSKSKMLLAFLIDRNGAMCDTGQVLCALWPEEPETASHRSQARVFLSDLQTTLTRLGVGEVLLRGHGRMGINTALVDCDYYQYLRGDPDAVRQFHGEYMSQYSFGENTLAALTQDFDRAAVKNHRSRE